MKHKCFVLLIPALGLAASGCATKSYVQETVGQSQARLGAQIAEQGKRVDEQARRVDEQTTRVESQAKQLDEMGGRFTKLETSVDEAGNIARSATTKADEAASRADEAQSRVSKLLANRNKRAVVETINVHFGVDRADLTDAAQTALAELIKELAAKPELVVELEGYADSRGGVEYNLRLSERRAEAVRRFLVTHGVDLSRVEWIGMGKLPDHGAKAARAKNRRVTLRLMLPEDQAAAAPTTSMR